MPTERHASLPEPVEQPPCLVDLARPEPVGSRCSRNPLTAPISTFSNPASDNPCSASSSVYGLKQMLDPVSIQLMSHSFVR